MTKNVEQYKLYDNGKGEVDAKLVRTLKLQAIRRLRHR